MEHSWANPILDHRLFNAFYLMSTPQTFLTILLLILTASTHAGQTGQSEAVKIYPSAIHAGSLLGSSVSISEDWLASGSPSGPNSFGSVEIFKWTQSGWELFQVIGSPTPGVGHAFGDDVVIDGDRLLVGAPGWGTSFPSSHPHFNSGRAHLFEWTGSTWQYAFSFRPTIPDVHYGSPKGSRFGDSVQMQGNRMAISAKEVFPAQQNGSGVVYMYQLVSGTWQPDGVLRPDLMNPDPVFGFWGSFGSSISLDNDRIAVGSSTLEGFVSVWKRTPTNWELEDHIYSPIASSTACDSRFGYSVSLDGHRLAIGLSSWCDFWIPHWPSLVTIEEFNGTNWQRTQIIQDANLLPGGERANMGEGTALDGDLLLIGSPGFRTANWTDPRLWLYQHTPGQGFQPLKIFKHNTLPINNGNGVLGRRIAFEPERGWIISGDARYQYPANTIHGFATGAVLHFDMELGQDLACTGSLNTTGKASRLAVTGSLAVHQDRLTLHASNLPPGEFSLFLYGQPGPPLPIQSGGALCLTGGVHRMLPPGRVGTWGQRVLDIDFSVPREAANLLPGTTWAFQVWHRDNFFGTSYTGTTNAVEATMQ